MIEENLNAIKLPHLIDRCPACGAKNVALTMFSKPGLICLDCEFQLHHDSIGKLIDNWNTWSEKEPKGSVAKYGHDIEVEAPYHLAMHYKDKLDKIRSIIERLQRKSEALSSHHSFAGAVSRMNSSELSEIYELSKIENYEESN